MVLSVQFQNATLAKYPDAVTELAVLALSYGVFSFFNASLQFVAQLANVYARSPKATRRSWRFVVIASTAIMLPLAVIAGTDSGLRLISLIFSIDTELTARVGEYLVLLCPMILLNGQRHYFSGLLVQAKLTGWMTLINFTYLGVVIIALLTGLALAIKPAHVVVGSESLRRHRDAGFTAVRALPPVSSTRKSRTRRRNLSGVAGLLHSSIDHRRDVCLEPPVLFAFVARTPDGIATIAALRVAFDFSMIFQQAANQFRHFFISFGFDDLASKRRFMAIICAGITAIMLIYSLTPLYQWVWGSMMGLPAELISIARDATLIMCLMPAIIIYRNYFHAHLMMMRRTGGMAYGSILRVVGIYACAQLFFVLGWLNPINASYSDPRLCH